MLIAQITDLHIRPANKKAYVHVDTNGMLEAAVASLQAMDCRPDVVLISGDLVDGGLAEEYVLLRELLAPLSMPVYVIPGNHDRREALHDAFAVDGYLPDDGPFLHYTVEDYPLRLIALDTVVPGEGYGDLCAARLDWLEARLREAPERQTIIFMHHPPFPTGLPGMDRINCRNGDALAAIVRRYPNIERVLCGHHHRPIQLRWAGTIGSIGPSTAHQVKLDLRPESRSMIMMEPPAFQLHVWHPEAGVISHVHYIGQFDGPYPFAQG